MGKRKRDFTVGDRVVAVLWGKEKHGVIDMIRSRPARDRVRGEGEIAFVVWDGEGRGTWVFVKSLSPEGKMKRNPGIKVSRVAPRQVRVEVGKKWMVLEVGRQRDSMRIVERGGRWTDKDRISFIAFQAAEWLVSKYEADFDWGPYKPKVTRRNPPRDDGYLSPAELAEKSEALRMARALYADLGYIYKSKGKWRYTGVLPARQRNNRTVEQVAPVRRNPPSEAQFTAILREARGRGVDRANYLLDGGASPEEVEAMEPLSGEWAGESVNELLGDLLRKVPEEDGWDVMSAYESGFRTTAHHSRRRIAEEEYYSDLDDEQGWG